MKPAESAFLEGTRSQRLASGGGRGPADRQSLARCCEDRRGLDAGSFPGRLPGPAAVLSHLRQLLL